MFNLLIINFSYCWNILFYCLSVQGLKSAETMPYTYIVFLFRVPSYFLVKGIYSFGRLNPFVIFSFWPSVFIDKFTDFDIAITSISSFFINDALFHAEL